MTACQHEWHPNGPYRYEDGEIIYPLVCLRCRLIYNARAMEEDAHIDGSGGGSDG